MKKYLLGIIVIVLLSAGIVVGLILIQQQQLFNQRASTGTGTATISMSPETGSFERNTDNTISVHFNGGGALIKAVAARISYSNLGVKASNLVINPDLISQGWTCNVKSISTDESTDFVDVGCLFLEVGNGFVASGDILLATFTVNASQVPLVNPVIFSFDPVETIIGDANSADIALTPSSTGSFTILDSVGGATATATSTAQATATATAQANATATATATATTVAAGLTPTPTSGTGIGGGATATRTPTATPRGTTASSTPASLPASGVNTPTLIGAAAGILLLIFAGAALIL